MINVKTALQNFKVSRMKRSVVASLIDVGSQIKAEGRVLVLLPFDSAIRSEILRDASVFATAFPGCEICLVSMPDDSVRDLARREGFRSFAPHRMEMLWYGFPNKSFFDRIRNLKGGLVIDLDFNKSPFNAAISAVSGAPLRVGLYGNWGPPIHNLEVKSRESGNQIEDFRCLLNVLASIRTRVAN
ncbi:MAG: hypothetical protein ABIK83_03535 [Candidatus Zixiibacteriota bacterium]